MSTCVNFTGVSNWIPVIGTLLGAAIGLTGGLLNSWLTNKNKITSEKEDRERGRIEALYETLEEIRLYYKGLLGSMLSKVHHNSTNTSKSEYTGIPPLVKLDMVLHMYFTHLTEVHEKFLMAKDDFGEKLAENLTSSYSEKSLKEKQKICEEYLRLFSTVDNEISNLQNKLASIVKA